MAWNGKTSVAVYFPEKACRSSVVALASCPGVCVAHASHPELRTFGPRLLAKSVIEGWEGASKDSNDRILDRTDGFRI